MHTHSVKEKIPQEILDGFVAMDTNKNGQISVKEFKHLLCDCGEKLTDKEFQKLLKEADIKGLQFKYEDFLKIIAAPPPDY